MTVKTSNWRQYLLPRTFDAAITRCCFLGIFTIACLMPAQNDTWWHLRAGQEMWSRHFVMLTDEFSFTSTGAAWPNHEWLSEVIFYAVYRIGGLPALTLLAAAAVTIALALAWRLMAGAATERILILAVALTAIVPVWTVRPHVFTLVLLMIVVHLALRERYWPIPPLFLLWANLHGGVAMGLVALGGVMAGRVYASGLAALKPLVLVTLASFAATFITPLGASLWWTIPESVHKSTINRIAEWRAASLFDGTYLAFWVIAALLPLTTVAFRRSIRARDHFLLIGIALAIMPLAIRYSRNIPPFLLVATPALTQNLAPWLGGSRISRRNEDWKLNAGVFVACAALCLAIVTVAWSKPAARLKWQPIPKQIVQEVEACGERVYNAYSDGGYLIWFAPGVRVFIDSRQDPYPLPFLQQYIQMEQTGDYRPLFERYGIKCAVLRDSSLIAARLQSDGWRTRVQREGWLVLRAADDSRRGAQDGTVARSSTVEP